MAQTTVTHQNATLSRRAFLRQLAALSGVSAGAVLLGACESPPSTPTAAPTVAPTTAASMTGAASAGVPGTVSGSTAATATTSVATATSVTGAATAARSAVAGASAVAPAGSAAVPLATATGAASAVAPGSAPATATATGNATPRIVAAANAFLATLSDAERKAVQFDFTNTAQKQRWSNLPEGLYSRAGLRWGLLGDGPRNAWLALMQATLSTEGYNRVVAEWNADDSLAAQQGSGGGGLPMGSPQGGTGMMPPLGGSPMAGGGMMGGGQLLFGKQYYWVALIGAPSESSPWQWQWGGHHVTVNATIAGANVSFTPSFIGAQPATYTDASGKTIRPLGDIEDEAFALIATLDAAQQKAAVLGNTGIDLVLGPGQDGKTLQPEGLPASQMNAAQQAALLKVIGHYTGLGYNAAARMAEVMAGLPQTYLAWYGPTAKGNPSYFRVSGPTLVIEYSPQGGGGTGVGLGGALSTDHIHGIYRDPTNDYGAKFVK